MLCRDKIGKKSGKCALDFRLIGQAYAWEVKVMLTNMGEEEQVLPEGHAIGRWAPLDGAEAIHLWPDGQPLADDHRSMVRQLWKELSSHCWSRIETLLGPIQAVEVR